MYHFIIDDHKIEQKGCRVASQFEKSGTVGTIFGHYKKKIMEFNLKKK